ncbi:MAG: fumarylacetoacetate hydrolase family protein [Hylemonella sp.]|nr:fumarylacetoacetate hydrolase family protein [Hylemonella sp.]
MSPSAPLDAATLLWTHWQAGSVVEALPQTCRPQSRAEGYAAQAQLEVASGRRLLGWKIAATSSVGQAHINVSGPIAGRLLSGQVHMPGATVPSAGNRMRVAEPELAFTLGQDLAPRDQPYTVDEVLAAVASLHPAIELPDSRFADFTQAGEAQLLADNACARDFLLGTAADGSWRDIDLRAHAVRGTVTRADGSQWTREGTGAAVLGDPRVALAWLVNELTSQGITLRAGQFITTGTCMTPLEILPGDAVVADFGVLGTLTMRFAA